VPSSIRSGLLCGALAAALAGQAAEACTRGVYIGSGDTVITLRSMDWMGPIGSNLWVLPQGMARDGAAGPETLAWTSRYGSVIVTAFDAATADGMNEAGLVANLLYLSESVYPDAPPAEGSRPMSISAWAQYYLDNFATVAEAVAATEAQPFYILPVMSPDGHAGTVHLSLSDATGDSAVFEYIDGALRVHHGREFQVMTNSPTFDQQLALDAYWKQIGGLTMLPGTNRAADRFVRVSFYLDALPKDVDRTTAVASAFSVIRNASVPLGITTPGQPNISSTLWRSVSDHADRRYYFESTTSPNVFWIDLAGLDLSEGAAVLKLPLTGNEIYAGEASSSLAPAEPFAFLPADPR
jgi:choloylglycine hydrolase